MPVLAFQEHFLALVLENLRQKRAKLDEKSG